MSGHSTGSSIQPIKGRPDVKDAVAASEDRGLELVLEAHAGENVAERELHAITAAPDRLYAVVDSLKNSRVFAESLKLNYIPANSVSVTDQAATPHLIRLSDTLAPCSEVQSVHANFDRPEELLANLSF